MVNSTQIVYTVSVYLYRDPSIFSTQKFTVSKYGSASGFLGVQLNPHSDLIGGYFTLQINGQYMNPYNDNTNIYPQIPYNADAGTLQTYLQNTVTGYQNIQIDTQSNLGYGYSYRWIILYKGYNITVYPLTITSGLSGDCNPTITTKTLTAYS